VGDTVVVNIEKGSTLALEISKGSFRGPYGPIMERVINPSSPK
jgi:hypothetical protein